LLESDEPLLPHAVSATDKDRTTAGSRTTLIADERDMYLS
jgi:hypothetical protein